MTGPTEPTRELVILVQRENLHLGPAPHLKQMLCNQQTEVPLCQVQTILQQVVCQLIVDDWSVDRLESQQSRNRPLVQSADIIIEGLGDHSSLFVDVQHHGHVIRLDQNCLVEDFVLQMENKGSVELLEALNMLMWSRRSVLDQRVLQSAMVNPGRQQWPPHPSMPASIVMVMVVLGNEKGIPCERCSLTDHH